MLALIVQVIDVRRSQALLIINGFGFSCPDYGDPYCNAKRKAQGSNDGFHAGRISKPCKSCYCKEAYNGSEGLELTLGFKFIMSIKEHAGVGESFSW